MVTGPAPVARRGAGTGTPTIGVLALQGSFGAHARALARLDVEAREVRKPDALDAVDGLVIPGGESTTLLRFLAYDRAWEPALRGFADRGGALLGTCAGLILLAREVRGPAQPSLGVLDVVVERNAYGRQVDSFTDEACWRSGEPLEMVTIRAPRIVEVGPEVEVLASHRSDPVLVRQGRVLGATFHPELTTELSVHRLFLSLVPQNRPEKAPPGGSSI